VYGAVGFAVGASGPLSNTFVLGPKVSTPNMISIHSAVFFGDRQIPLREHQLQ